MSVDPSVSPPAVPPVASDGVLESAARHDRRLFESLNEGVWERDLATDQVWYSPRYKSLLGFEDHELPNLADAVRDRVHVDDRAKVQAAYDRAAVSGIGECEARILTKEGGHRWFRGRLRVWPGPAGHPGTLVGALYDVHNQVMAAETLQAQQAVLEERVVERTRKLAMALQLAEAERRAAEDANRAKASFLAHMSHELRTPLNGVLGMTQLARDLAFGAEQRRYLELAQQAGQSLLAILDDVLDFARAEAGRLQLREERVDLAALAAESLRGFMPTVRRKGLQVGFDYLGEITHVRADAGRLRQIIGNLLGNAIKYTDAGRVLLIVAVDAIDAGQCRVRLRVRDTGTGIDAATQARIFDPFEQGDSGMARRHGGTGLGLSVVRTLAQQMGGGVAVRSRPGAGSEFRVELCLGLEPDAPLVTTHLGLGPDAPLPTTEPGGHAWLLVGDVVQAQGIGKRLSRLGWTAEILPTLADAVERLEGAHGARLPGCVLVAEDALARHADLARLRQALRAGVPVTLLLRPDFDLSTVHLAAEQWHMRIAIAPLTPTDLRAVVAPEPTIVPARALAPAAVGAHQRARCSVLVVEDNPLNQIIAREMVAALGFHPAVVGSGEEAVLSCRSTPPDLVLMDIQMPGMDGLETTRRLRALQDAGELRRFPIIALTAHAMASDRQASIAAGMDEHLTKPVRLDQLRSVIGQWLPVDE